MMSTKPRVWRYFTVKSKNGDMKLRIQDAPKDRFEEISHMFGQHFAAGETFHKLAGVTKNEEAKKECQEFSMEMMKDSSVVICCRDDTPDSEKLGEIVAAGIMTLTKKDDPEEDFDIKTKTKEMERMFELMGPIYDMFDVMKELNLESLYDDRGVVVHPDYRGLGIAQLMFNVRRQICKEEGVDMTSGLMTGFGSQKAAERDGWETVFEIAYEELEQMFDVTFSDVPPTCKIMAARPL